MRQRGRALGVAVLSLAVLFVSWWFGPYGPGPDTAWARLDVFYWLWSGFFGLVFVLSLLGAVSREDWAIAEQEIVMTGSVGPWRTTRRVSTGRPLRIRIQIVESADDQPTFPYQLRFLDATGNDARLRIDLQLTRSVDQMLDALRAVLPLEVADPRQNRRANGYS
jgi:hypothetical protein